MIGAIVYLADHPKSGAGKISHLELGLKETIVTWGISIRYESTFQVLLSDELCFIPNQHWCSDGQVFLIT